MATFRIKSDEIFNLNKLNHDEITITKISLVQSDTMNDIRPLFSPISIITKYPNRFEYTRPFSIESYFSNTKADFSTDLPISESIKNCEFTQLKINKLHDIDFSLEVEYFPSPKFISKITLSKLWGKYNLRWDLNRDVNILVGINGSGKTTLLNLIEDVFIAKNNLINDTNSQLIVEFDTNEIIESKSNFGNFQIIENFNKLSTFDVQIGDKNKKGRETTTDLNDMLSDIINGSGESLSFIKVSDIYREEENTLLRLGKIKEADKLRNKIPNLFELINNFFKDTNKTIQIDTSKNIYFKLEDKRVELKQLSAGEKQLLLILFSVFIQQEKPFILMMDEPEISLHIRWQQKLISTIRALNPNCQLIIATHSPSIFGDGYGDKLFWMEKLWL